MVPLVMNNSGLLRVERSVEEALSRKQMNGVNLEAGKQMKKEGNP
jgi:hypothetical protein